MNIEYNYDQLKKCISIDKDEDFILISWIYKNDGYYKTLNNNFRCNDYNFICIFNFKEIKLIDNKISLSIIIKKIIHSKPHHNIKIDQELNLIIDDTYLDQKHNGKKLFNYLSYNRKENNFISNKYLYDNIEDNDEFIEFVKYNDNNILLIPK